MTWFNDWETTSVAENFEKEVLRWKGYWQGADSFYELARKSKKLVVVRNRAAMEDSRKRLRIAFLTEELL